MPGGLEEVGGGRPRLYNKHNNSNSNNTNDINSNNNDTDNDNNNTNNRAGWREAPPGWRRRYTILVYCIISYYMSLYHCSSGHLRRGADDAMADL